MESLVSAVDEKYSYIKKGGSFELLGRDDDHNKYQKHASSNSPPLLIHPWDVISHKCPFSRVVLIFRV
jgi:hypothetical protein